jgi:hypothetical protein
MKLRVLTAASAALLVTACGSGISTSTDYDPQTNFSGFSTYDWIDSEGRVDDITSSRVRSSVDAAMSARGFTKSSSNPDLAVSYQVPTQQRSSFTTINSGWGGNYRWGGGWGMGMGMGTSTTTEQTWTEGSLILAMFSNDSQLMVWTGTATTDLDSNRTPQERQELIDSAVSKMMEDFPPGN